MREPPAATNGASVPEPAPGEAAARMEQVIDRFIWQDDGRETKSRISSVPPPIPHGADGSDVATDIVARLAPRHLDMPDTLPRIVTSSLQIRPTATPGDEGALPTSASRPLFPFQAIAEAARNRRNRLENDSARDRLGKVHEFSTSASWRKARRVVTTAAALTCVFSTGVIWAKHRSEMVAEISGSPAEIAIAMPEPAAVGGAGLGQSIRNTPVLIREGASADMPEVTEAGPHEILPAPASSEASVSVTAPVVARTDSEIAQPPPMPPIAPVVRVVPIVPIVPSVPAPARMAVVAPGPSIADAATTPAPPLDRHGLNALATRPTVEAPDHRGPASTTAKRPKSAIDRRPSHRDHATRSKSPTRSTDAPASSRGAAPKVARGYVPPDGWDGRRQGLRTEPEPEPSMFKKLIGYVWPPGKAWNEAQQAKPTAPTAPAVTAKPFYWSDNGRARP